MLGITKISKGRMGNRLFHYNFLRQIAKKTGVGYFHKRLPDAKYFDEMDKKLRLFSLFKKNLRYNSKQITTQGPDEFIKTIFANENAGIDTIFDSPMLGEVFFDYLFYSPQEFINIKNEFKKPFGFDVSDKIVVGVHFRGSDFKSWNEEASLKPDYYIKAIDYCQKYFKNKSIIFVLFTDDPYFNTYLEIIMYLKNNRIVFSLSENLRLPIVDLYQISQCDVIISSPSTFAIFAGCLGKEKRIIHSKKWLDYAVANKDIFWVKLISSVNPYYRLWLFL